MQKVFPTFFPNTFFLYLIFLSVRKRSKTFRLRHTSKGVNSQEKIPGGLGLDIGEVLELELHRGDIVPGVGLHQVLDVLMQIPSRNLSITGENSLKREKLIFLYLNKLLVCFISGFTTRLLVVIQ